ncbi:Nucleotidyl transferase AbiEii toxin, Type IV TA system [Variovorax sp. OV700]|nr:Nucleotidyl transferase AbiEii toxin, Type IV TA system [Variovorax sp. OV700]
MAEFFALSAEERLEALVQAADASGRPPHLLEKDIWVVWSLRHIFAAPYASHLVFKGGTSLSKAYGVIQRFSEDVDLTYDIRAIAADLIGDAGTPLPASKIQEKRWSKEIRARLVEWVRTEVVPHRLPREPVMSRQRSCWSSVRGLQVIPANLALSGAMPLRTCRAWSFPKRRRR